MVLLDRKSVAGVIKSEMQSECEKICQRGDCRPWLWIVLVGNNPASVAKNVRE